MSGNGLELLKRWLTTREAPWMVQFLKYGICGVLGVVVYAGTTYLMVSLWPERVAESLPDALRSRNLNIFQGIAFVPANVVAYLLNRTLVFTPGRHRMSHEFFWFTVVAMVSAGFGLLATDLLIRFWSVPNWTGTAASVVASGLMNFVCRKFFVFAK